MWLHYYLTSDFTSELFCVVTLVPDLNRSDFTSESFCVVTLVVVVPDLNRSDFTSESCY